VSEVGYAGPATLTIDGRAVPVHAVLDARHEPQDGRLHWFGRLRAAEGAWDAAAESVTLDAGAGPVAARLGDVDPWGRVRVTGVAPLPYRRVVHPHGESGISPR
jgi:uncharacterized protein DUF4873